MFAPSKDPSGPVASLARPRDLADALRFRLVLIAGPPSPGGCPLLSLIRALLVRGLRSGTACSGPLGLRRILGRQPLLVLVTGGPRAVAVWFAFAAQRGDLLLEVRQRFESPVDGGESQIGDLVKVAKRSQDRQAHLVRGNLAAAATPDRVLDQLGQDRELVLADRSSLAGPPDTTDDLVSVEGLGHAAALGHHEDDRLLGGETATAGRARPPAANRCTVLGSPAVDDPAIGMLAVRAVHAIHLPSGAPGPRSDNTNTGKLHPCNSQILWSQRPQDASVRGRLAKVCGPRRAEPVTDSRPGRRAIADQALFAGVSRHQPAAMPGPRGLP